MVRNWSGRAEKRQAPANAASPDMQRSNKKRMSTGDLQLFRRSKCRSKDEEEGEDTRAVPPKYYSFPGKMLLHGGVSSTASLQLQNENWDEDVNISSTSAPSKSPRDRPSTLLTFAASWKLSKHEPCFSMTRNAIDAGCSNRSQPLPLKPSLKSDSTPRSGVAKHVHFSFRDEEMRYEVTKDEIKNSWLDIDVTEAIELMGNKSNDLILVHGLMVSFGPSGRSTSSDIDICKDVKEYMVRIQHRTLINEILGQREILRESVFEEQARQKREGVVDAEENSPSGEWSSRRVAGG